jgi:O-methyltransferase
MKRIAVFGAGSALADLLAVLPEGVEIVGLGDNSAATHGTEVRGIRVHPPEAFARLPFDRVVIAARACDAIRDQLVGLGVPAEKITAMYPSYGAKLQREVGRELQQLDEELGIGVPLPGIATMYLWPEPDPFWRTACRDDFVRTMTLRLLARQLQERSVPGSIGEVGVFRGEFAALLNRLFPDRTLHLFDTFRGFAHGDVAAEAAGRSEARAGDFKDTSVELVMSRLPHPAQARVHAGFFPETARGIDDAFALVSLDADLFAPMLAGLEWFYPRLSKGGAILVHDYNNRRFPGVRRAVDQFIAATGAVTMPIPDFAGTVVVLK